MMSSKLTDDELWDAVKEDNYKAFVVLYNKYWKTLYKTAIYYLHDHLIAEEITHDVFVSLWEKRKTARILDFEKYIRMTARYQVYKQLRAAKLKNIPISDDQLPDDQLQIANESEKKIQYQDIEYELKQVLEDLPLRCREIFWMSRMEQLSNDEIAQKLHISKRTVENQITIASKHVRLAYAKILHVTIPIVFLYLLLK